MAHKSTRKTKPAKVRADKEKPAKLHRFAPFCKQTLVILFGTVISIGTLNAVEAAVHENPIYRLSSDSLTLQGLPDWMVPASVLQGDLALPFGKVSIFTPGLELEVRQTLARAAWVREVVSVERRLPRDLLVVLEPRRPVARIRLGLQHYLVDCQGVRLPEDLYSGGEELPFVDGVETHVPDPGRAFVSDTMTQALSLLKTWHERDIAAKYGDMQILKITCAAPRDIARGEPKFTVVIPRRVRLYFDAGDEMGELSFGQALDNLEKILFRDPQLNQVKDRIDLRWKRPTLR